MSEYLLQEDGTSKFALEDGSGFYLQEFGEVDPSFIASVTVVYAPTLPEVSVPFISSATVLYAPTVAYTGQTPIVTAAGTFKWLCPAGITSVYVACHGGGGPGGIGSGVGVGGAFGGGGGAFSARVAVPVTPGTLYTFVVGAGGVSGSSTDGGSSSFTGDSSVQVIAVGGGHGTRSAGSGQGGTAASCTGDTGLKFSGGNGGANGSGNDGGGGAASGNVGGTGNNGGDAPPSGSGTGGAGASGGGSGGNGGNPSINNAQVGFAPGGAGGGGGTSENGGDGAAGGVSIIIHTRTQTSIARIQKTLTKTQTAKVRVQATVTKAQAARARITKSVPKSQTARARIQKTLTKAQTVIARIQSSTTKTHTARARITNSSTKIQTATAHISNSAEIHPPFISSATHVWSIFSVFDPNLTFSGPGNGGETFGVRLNLNGVTTTATLASSIGLGSGAITLTGDSGMPSIGIEFAVTIDSEQILLISQGAGSYLMRMRGMGNTTVAVHSSGATVSWGDSYDMAIINMLNINTDFTSNIEGTGSSLYTGWLMAFDSTQAYKDDSTRYPMHITELVGVFTAGLGTTGTSKTDGPQPSAIHAPEAASDHCGAALTVPALITDDILPGDVAVARYTNPEAFVLDIGPRSGAINSWYGLKRVDTTDHDVTYTNPNGIVVDTNGGYSTYTGSVNTEPDEPLPEAIGIAMDSSDLAGHAVATPNPVPWLTVTLPGADRYFTDSIHYNERGWPIGVITCRQGDRRIPLWQSWDWHNFSYVYSGFGTDDSFAQVVINRNGMTGILPTISLPGPQDIDGPDAYWDDGTYFFGASWCVVLVATPYLVVGPVIGGFGPGNPGPGGSETGTIPTVIFPGGPGEPPVITPPTIEGGSGGDIIPGSTGLHVWQIF